VSSGAHFFLTEQKEKEMRRFMVFAALMTLAACDVPLIPLI